MPNKQINKYIKSESQKFQNAVKFFIISFFRSDYILVKFNMMLSIA